MEPRQLAGKLALPEPVMSCARLGYPSQYPQRIRSYGRHHRWCGPRAGVPHPLPLATGECTSGSAVEPGREFSAAVTKGKSGMSQLQT